MFKLGEWQNLVVNRKVAFGFYLSERGGSEEVLLPGGEIPDDTQIGEPVRVFLYRDSKDRMIATTEAPALEAGGLARLAVSEVGKNGAFLSWGLSKDLFLPFREQTCKVEEGKEYLVTLYVDRTERLCASMRIHDVLEKEAPYAADEHVEGIIYDFNPRYGYFVAVDDRYDAMIPKKEDTGGLAVGMPVRARVTQVREDGRLNLSLREKAYLQMDADAEAIVAAMEKRGGSLPFSDKASPERIRNELHMSKAAFKRGVGRLLKEGCITLSESSIRLKKGTKKEEK